MSSSNLMGTFCLQETSLLVKTMRILTHTRLQGVTWNTFQPPLEGQAGRASTGIFLRCAGAVPELAERSQDFFI